MKLVRRKRPGMGSGVSQVRSMGLFDCMPKQPRHPKPNEKLVWAGQKKGLGIENACISKFLVPLAPAKLGIPDLESLVWFLGLNEPLHGHQCCSPCQWLCWYPYAKSGGDGKRACSSNRSLVIVVFSLIFLCTLPMKGKTYCQQKSLFSG